MKVSVKYIILSLVLVANIISLHALNNNENRLTPSSDEYLGNTSILTSNSIVDPDDSEGGVPPDPTQPNVPIEHGHTILLLLSCVYFLYVKTKISTQNKRSPENNTD